jgi:capsular exopolysaccharide synthesis family protein
VELQTYWRIARTGWWMMLIGLVVGVLLAVGWVVLQKPVYTADAGGFVSASAGSGSDTGGALIADNLAKSKVKSYLDVGTWRSVADDAISQLGLNTQPEALVRQVKVTNPTDTVNLVVQASASTPEGARDLAQAWVKAMSNEVKKLESASGGEALVQLVPGDSAQLPTSPSSPNWRIAVVIGAVIGLAAGIGAAAIRYVVDRRIRSADIVERETGHAVVGTIPFEKSFTSAGRLIPFGGGYDEGIRSKHFRVAEAMRELRTNIQFMDVDRPPRIIVVTSPLPGDGKSTTSANLAIILAASGQRVVLVDGDLRRPMVASVFGLVEGVGLTDVLAGRADFEDVAQPVGQGGNLSVLGAGLLPPNPSEVLGSARMRDLLQRLAVDSTVIIDAPPLLPVTDAAVLAHNADGAMIVASVGKTTVERLQKAIQNLDRAGARCLGVVINRVPVRGRGKGYDEYRYSGDYYAAPAATTVPLDSPGAAASPSVTEGEPRVLADQPSRRSRRTSALSQD